MLSTHFTEEMLGLQGINTANVENLPEALTIYIQEKKAHLYISCSAVTDTTHDYRTQIIKDIQNLQMNKSHKFELRLIAL